jgi:hypothetical protein
MGTLLSKACKCLRARNRTLIYNNKKRYDGAKSMRTKSFKTSVLTATVIAGMAVACSANAVANTFEIEHLPKVQHAGNISVSNDGEITAYTISVPRDVLNGDKDGTADTHLYVIKDDSKPIPFITTHGSVSALQFSADNATLAGGEAEKVFEYETSIGDYRVTNDGSTLHFVAREKDDKKDLKDKGFKAYAYEEDQRLASLWSVSLIDDDAKLPTKKRSCLPPHPQIWWMTR